MKLTNLSLSLFLTVFAFAPVHAQSSSTERLMKFAGNIHQFNGIFPQEKIYLQFDNTSYYTGETIWFKAYVVNASNLQKAQSKVLYVDLVSPTGILLKQQKLKIVGGQADGSLPLMDGSTAQAREKRGVMEYPSGFYEVRAYTSFMQNFSEESIFSRVFAVYEKPQEEGNYYGENPTILLRKLETSDFRPKTEKLNNINCSFYPEGGHLIIGKPCRVAFKVTDDTGFGIDAQGTLDGSAISFSTIHDGMGEFTFTPDGKRNQVRITAGGTTRSFNLPQAETAGIAINMKTLGDSIILDMDPTPEFKGSTLGITLTCRGEVMDFDTVVFGSGSASKIFPLRRVPEGVCRIHVFDSNGTLFASRSLYHHSIVTKAPVLEVSSDKNSYGPFEKVNLKFNLDDGHGNPFHARFSLAVRDTRSQKNAFADDLRTSLLLSSDLKGLIETPGWYFDSESPEREHALDLLCLVQGWERYDWQTMTGQKEFREVHRLEESLTLNGWVLNSSGKKPVEGIEVLAALMPQDKTLSETYTYKTDSSGYFGFDIGTEFYDKARFTIDARTNKKRLIGTSARIKLDRSLVPAVRAYKPEELIFTSNQSGSKAQDKKKQEDEKKDDMLPTVISASTGLLLPDVDIEEERMYLDYFTFNAFDVAKDVEIDLDKGEYSTDLIGYLLDKGYLVLLDDSGNIESINGFAPFFYVHDTKKYQNQGVFESPSTIDSKDIKSIIVFDRPMYLMNILVQCPLYQDYLAKTTQDLTGSEILFQRMLLVDILVKEGRELSTRDELFNINKRITTVDGYSRPYSFYSPEYPNGPVLGDVDYRRTLYWNPNVITDEEGKAQVEFYNSSITRHFNVEAAGITSSGVPYILDAGF